MTQQNNLNSGIFDQKKSLSSNANRAASGNHMAPSQEGRAQPPQSSSVSHVDETAAKLNNMSAPEDKKKADDANEANKYSEKDIKMVKDMIFKTYCSDTVKKEIYPGYTMSIEMFSLSVNEFDFLSQIIFDYKKKTLDEKGYNNVCDEKFESLFNHMMLALQVNRIDEKLIGDDIEQLKTVIKECSKSEIIGITNESEAEKLTKLKSVIVGRAQVFMDMDHNLSNFLLTERAGFNKKTSELLSRSALVKK